MAAIGRTPFDLVDYGSNGNFLPADAILARIPELAAVADIVPTPFSQILSTEITAADWLRLAAYCRDLAGQGFDGIVVGHGTASLEETAYFLNLTLAIDIPVVVTGSQRPLNGLSSDAPLNLANAVRVAGDPGSRGRGVLVVLNDEIHAAREVAKQATARLQAFNSPEFGSLGHVDGEEVFFYRSSDRRHAPDAPFDVAGLKALPRVDIAYSHAGADGTAIRAFVAAGAAGIVSAGMAPGLTTLRELEAMREATAAGVVVVQSTRVAAGRVTRMARLSQNGLIPADNLNPQKARVLLMLGLACAHDADAIAALFRTC